MGVHNLIVSELTMHAKKGEAYVNEVESEFKDAANEGVGGKDIGEVLTGKEEK